VIGDEPTGDAIGLTMEGKKYLPAGVYMAETRSFVPIDLFPALADAIEKPVQQVATTTTQDKHYVLENSYFQLVFSNRGGAITEINLPFQSDKDQASVVRRIAFDDEMVEEAPDNARFPSSPYYTAGDKDLHDQGTLGGYYPLLRRDLIGAGGR